jgi:hypothetical protein
MISEALYTVPEAAERYRLSAWTIWDMLKTGRLLRTKVAGKTFIRESELQKLVTETRNEPKRSKARDAR